MSETKQTGQGDNGDERNIAGLVFLAVGLAFLGCAGLAFHRELEYRSKSIHVTGTVTDVHARHPDRAWIGTELTISYVFTNESGETVSGTDRATEGLIPNSYQIVKGGKINLFYPAGHSKSATLLIFPASNSTVGIFSMIGFLALAYGAFRIYFCHRQGSQEWKIRRR